MKQVAAIGECMIELSELGNGAMALSYGGDTLNTLVYVSRLGISADYVTALGQDYYSDWMCDAWQAEGVGTDLVVRVADRLPGLYTIRTDANGERTFFYWRDQSPARDLFGFPEAGALSETLLDYDVVYISGITLSLYTQSHRTRLFEVLDAVRRKGGRIMFDTNHRPNLWRDLDAARQVYSEALKRVDIALPTLDDEQAIYGDVSAEACAARLHDFGVGEVVVKMGRAGCLVSSNGISTRVELEQPRQAVDTTGAGDSFNAGYLAARLKDKEILEAARFAQQVAGEVVMHRGAIIPKEAVPEMIP